MGLASLILGILGFMISVTIFKDLSLILCVLGLVLGIIALVKKKAKVMAIIAIVLCVLGFGIAVGTSGSTSSDRTTGRGITNSSGDSKSKTVKVSTDKVEMSALGITAKGDFVIKVTNNNEGSVCLSTITTVFKDANGAFAVKKAAQESFAVIPAGQSIVVHDFGYGEDFSQYPTYEFSCELANISDNFLAEGIEIESSDTGKQIAVTVKNGSDKTIGSTEVSVDYYAGDQIVGVDTGYADSTTAAGASTYINVDYPKDSKYKDVGFDSYQVSYIHAEIQK
jgi:hypothetical protein